MCVPPVRGPEAMVTVTFVSCVQGYQEGRVGEIVKRLRGDHPEWKVDALPPETSKPLLAKYKLQFGPAILVNDRIEFVGIPRYRMMPTNSIRSFTRIAGPNCSLYLARRGLLVSGGRASTFHSGWSPRSRFTISPTRPSWYP